MDLRQVIAFSVERLCRLEELRRGGPVTCDAANIGHAIGFWLLVMVDISALILAFSYKSDRS